MLRAISLTGHCGLGAELNSQHRCSSSRRGHTGQVYEVNPSNLCEESLLNMKSVIWKSLVAEESLARVHVIELAHQSQVAHHPECQASRTNLSGATKAIQPSVLESTVRARLYPCQCQCQFSNQRQYLNQHQYLNQRQSSNEHQYRSISNVCSNNA